MIPPRRRSEDPDNDPLNIPDIYFIHTDSSKYDKGSISNEINLLVSTALTLCPCTHNKSKASRATCVHIVKVPLIRCYWIHLFTLVTDCI
jgi:hypothetical protein